MSKVNYSNGKACKGLVTTREAIEDEKWDPDNLEIKQSDEDLGKFGLAVGDDLKNPEKPETEEELIHNYRAYYDWEGLEGGFCIAAFFVDGDFDQSRAYDTTKTQKADPVTVTLYG